MMDHLEKVPGLQVFRDSTGQYQSGLFSLVADGMDCETVAEQLAHQNVAVRAGLHCAPLAHQTVGTEDTGTVRLSFSVFNSPVQVDQTAAIFRRIVKNGKKAW